MQIPAVHQHTKWVLTCRSYSPVLILERTCEASFSKLEGLPLNPRSQLRPWYKCELIADQGLYSRRFTNASPIGTCKAIVHTLPIAIGNRKGQEWWGFNKYHLFVCSYISGGGLSCFATNAASSMQKDGREKLVRYKRRAPPGKSYILIQIRRCMQLRYDTMHDRRCWLAGSYTWVINSQEPEFPFSLKQATQATLMAPLPYSRLFHHWRHDFSSR